MLGALLASLMLAIVSSKVSDGVKTIIDLFVTLTKLDITVANRGTLYTRKNMGQTSTFLCLYQITK